MSAGTGWDTDWMRDAACAQIPGLPWTEDGKIPAVLVDLMADTCAACPVFAECEAFADLAEVTAGWWAGASRNDRQHASPLSRYLHAYLALDDDPTVGPDAA